MDQIQNVRNNTDQYPEYPVLRLANPLPGHPQYPPNDNENNMYYEHDNDNSTFKSTTMNTTGTTSSRSTSNITNLTGTLTNSHPLMHSPPSPVSPDFPDLIPEKKPSKHLVSTHRNHSQVTKFTFKPEAHSSHINLHKVEGASHVFSLSADNIQTSAVDAVNSQLRPTVRRLIKKDISSSDLSDVDDTEDNSLYEATLSPNLQNVSLTMAEKPADEFDVPVYRRRRISLLPINDDGDSDDDVSSIDSVSSSKLNFELINDLLDSSEDITRTSESHEVSAHPRQSSNIEPIEEYSAADERRDSRHWQKIILPSGEHRSIDMRVIEPYKRILSHGGYLKAGGHNAIVVFSACFLPDKSRVDYDYVMDNLFLYVLATLDQLVTEDYVLVYLHGGAGRAGRPSFGWIKKCYQLIDRKLRKNLKRLYIVHPTIWVRTLLLLCKPFVSSKFYKKITYVHSLSDLADQLPIEHAAIPDKVKNYERSKFSC